MKATILLNVTYTDETNKFWMDSSLKNKLVDIDTEENIHLQIAEICKESDCVEFSYKAMPQSNIFVDLKDGSTKRVGYTYRCKSEIQDGYKWVKALFTVWVTIKQVADFEIDEIENK